MAFYVSILYNWSKIGSQSLSPFCQICSCVTLSITHLVSLFPHRLYITGRWWRQDSPPPFGPQNPSSSQNSLPSFKNLPPPSLRSSSSLRRFSQTTTELAGGSASPSTWSSKNRNRSPSSTFFSSSSTPPPMVPPRSRTYGRRSAGRESGRRG